MSVARSSYVPFVNEQNILSEDQTQEIEMQRLPPQSQFSAANENTSSPYDTKETSPLKIHTLLDHDAPPSLCKYVFSVFATNNTAEKVSCLSKMPVLLASSLAISSGYISWYPLIVGVLDMDIKSQAIKAIFAGGSWISYGSLYAWGTMEVVRELFKKRSPTEAILLKNTTHPCLTIFYQGSIILLGFGATLPNAYFAYIFNQQSIPWTLVNIAGSWGICAYPIHNMIAELEMGCIEYGRFQGCLERAKWDQIRKFLSLQLDCLLQDVSKIDTHFISHVEEEGGHLREKTRAKDYTKIFFRTILSQYVDEKQSLEHIESILTQKKIQYPVKILSTILPISNIYANAKATWNLVSQFTDSVAVKSLIMPIALAPSYLTYSLNRDCLLFLIRQIVNKTLGKEPRSLSSIYCPKTRTAVILTATVLSLLSSSVDYVTARAIFSEDTPLDWTATIASIVNSLALTLLPMIDLSTMLLDYLLSLLGNPDITFKHSMAEKIKELKFFLVHSSHKEFKRFISDMMEDKIIEECLKSKFPWIGAYR